MKALKITVITIVLLITAYADAYGQYGKTPQNQGQKVSKLPPEFSNLSREQKKALLNTTNGKVNVLNEKVNVLNEVNRALERSKQGAQAPDAEHAKCKTESAWDGSDCLGADQENGETTADDEMLYDWKNVKAFIKVISVYNKDLMRLKESNTSDEQSVEALSVSRDEVIEKGSIVINNTDNVKLQNVASGIIEKVNRNNPVNKNDVEALEAIFKDCPVCN